MHDSAVVCMTEQGTPREVRAENRERFARALNDLLAVNRMSKNQLAQGIDASPSAVTSWTLAREEPRPATVFAIERELAVKPGTLSRFLGFCPCDVIPASSVEAEILNSDLPDMARQSVLGHYRAMVLAFSER